MEHIIVAQSGTVRRSIYIKESFRMVHYIYVLHSIFIDFYLISIYRVLNRFY